ncbi:MAG: hypothetical protein ABI315_05945 [Bacteroidia bacterium]
MKKTAFSLLILLITSVTVLNSCKKGDPGPAGEDGNANVTSTDPILIPAKSWTLDSNVWLTNFPVPAITGDIASKGMVQVYIKYGSQWWALPDINNGNATSYGFTMGKVFLFNANDDGSVPLAPLALTFRVVAISPSGGRAMNPDVDLKDYEAVKKYYHLKD